MFSAYFDKSGDVDQVATVVGGYLATVTQWESFDADWRLLLAKEELPYFHMKKFAACRGAFSLGWDNEIRRARFLSQLCEIIAAHVRHSFSWIVINSAFYEVDQEYELALHAGNPYTFCARACAAKIRDWLNHSGYKGQPVEYIFESGDRGRWLLDAIFERDCLPEPQYKPKLPPAGREAEVFTPLQAADFLAWEHQKHVRLYELNQLFKLRKSFQALEKVPNKWILNEKAELVKFCKNGNIQRRTSKLGGN